MFTTKEIQSQLTEFKTFTVDDFYSNSTKITGKGEPNATITAAVNDTDKYSTKVKSNGTYEVYIPSQD